MENVGEATYSIQIYEVLCCHDYYYYYYYYYYYHYDYYDDKPILHHPSAHRLTLMLIYHTGQQSPPRQ